MHDRFHASAERGGEHAECPPLIFGELRDRWPISGSCPSGRDFAPRLLRTSPRDDALRFANPSYYVEPRRWRMALALWRSRAPAHEAGSGQARKRKAG
jgi:hypothetical protein